MAAHEDVGAYLADLGNEAREAVARIRALVHVAGWSKHVSIYPEPRGDAALADALAPYSSDRGTLTFALDDVPYDLVARVIAALAQERTNS